jgi:hypothetical protein
MKSDLIEWGVSAGSGMVPGHWPAIIRRNLRDASMTGRFRQSGGRNTGYGLESVKKTPQVARLDMDLGMDRGSACLYQ